MNSSTTIKCPGCAQEVMKGAAIECNFKQSNRPAESQPLLDTPGNMYWLCMECKYIVENQYGDLSKVTPEDAFTLLYSVRVRGGGSCCRCSNCIIL